MGQRGRPRNPAHQVVSVPGTCAWDALTLREICRSGALTRLGAARFQGFHHFGGVAAPKTGGGIGKAFYATTDARKYEDYVTTDTPAPAVVPVVPKA